MSLPAFGIRNPVPVNLLMVAVLIMGIYAALTMRREFFPEVDSQAAYVIAVYPGATPEEIEESIIFKLEDALWGIDEIKELKTSIREGSASIVTEFEDGADVPKVLDEIERTVDQLQDLPRDAERIQVTELQESRDMKNGRRSNAPRISAPKGSIDNVSLHDGHTMGASAGRQSLLHYCDPAIARSCKPSVA